MVVLGLLGWVCFLKWGSLTASPPAVIIHQSGDVGFLEMTSRVVDVTFFEKGELCKGGDQSCLALHNGTRMLTPCVKMTIGACSTSAGK